jgi:hypothetical protein
VTRSLRRRVAVLEQRLERRTGEVVLMAEEAAALACAGPAYPHASTAMVKFVARYGLERMVLASFGLATLSA